MPERNLVKVVRTHRCLLILIVALIVVSMQPGCSKLGQSSLTRDMLAGKRTQERWINDSPDSANRYVSDPYADLNSVEQKDEARIVGVGDGNSADIEVKLTALQPDSDSGKATTDSASSVGDLFGDHPSGCECCKPKVTPKLPFAEPIDPPQVTVITPPAGLIHQPLTPILFNGRTREIRKPDVKESQNSLRRNEQWSHEKAAKLTQKQNESALDPVDPALVESDPVGFNPSQYRESSRGESLRRKTIETQVPDALVSQIESSVPPLGDLCREADCNGNCGNSGHAVQAKNNQPTVKSDPIVIVATTSANTIPPFAQRPPDDLEIEFTPNARNEMQPSALNMETSVAGLDAESFDDLSDDEWLEMFGPMSPDGPSCRACQSSQCQNPSCEMQSETVVETGFPVDPVSPQSLNMDAVVGENAAATSTAVFEDTKIQSDIARASAIDSNSHADSNNDFQPAGHSTETGSFEVESEFPSWSQPKTTESIPVSPSGESSVFESLPTADSKTAELPLLDLGPVSVPDGAKVMLPKQRQPGIYSGPAVRFEIIDNTVPWDVNLSETIQFIKSQLAIENEPTTRNGMEVNLRLLEVLQRQMADVEIRKDSLTNQETQYWQHQLDAITVMLKSNEAGESDLARHNTAINTLDHLRKAVERLESIAELRISNGAFCTEVSGFGQFRTFPTNTFAANQRMLIYCEVENYSTMQKQVDAKTQIHTRLRGSFVIYDSQGRVVQQAEFPMVEDISRKRRRDFYMHFPIQLANLSTGLYKLELMVEDLSGNKTGSIEPSMEFHVK